VRHLDRYRAAQPLVVGQVDEAEPPWPSTPSIR
jgi:hypothetical protein